MSILGDIGTTLGDFGGAAKKVVAGGVFDEGGVIRTKTPAGAIIGKSPLAKIGKKAERPVPRQVAAASGVSNQRNTVSEQRMAKSRGVQELAYGKDKWAGLKGVSEGKVDEAVQRATGKTFGPASSAGLRSEKSVYIHYNGSGYDNPMLANSRPAANVITAAHTMGVKPQTFRPYTDLRMRGGDAARRLTRNTNSY